MSGDLLPKCPVRTRFAPSPTGYLHIGGARTALFSWAFARKQGGDFVLRIEDTDRVRSMSEAVRAIIESLDWLGLDYTGPFRQLDRQERHRQLAWRLVEEDKAYRCYMTPEELEELREQMRRRKQKPRYDRRWRDSKAPPPPGVRPAVRLKMPLEGHVLLPDLIKGDIRIDSRELDDPVILRADGSPTYNFACAVDDFDMNITHVVRGEDHISNTPKQTQVIRALGGEIPSYAHMPLILARALDGGGAPAFDDAGMPRYERMSKRNGAVDVLHYRAEGFLPEALANYLACLGWSPGEREIFGLGEFVERFSLSEVNQPAARFDADKLRWVNNQHMRLLGPKRLGEMTDPPMGESVAELFYMHAQTLRDLEHDSAYFRSPPALGDGLSAEDAAGAPMADFAARLGALERWEAASIKGLIKQVAQEHGVKFKDVGMPLRLALTGRRETPDIAAIAALLGKRETLERLGAAGCPDPRAN